MIPGSKTPSHIAQNIDLFDFALTDEDMAWGSDSPTRAAPEHNDEVLAGFLACRARRAASEVVPFPAHTLSERYTIASFDSRGLRAHNV